MKSLSTTENESCRLDLWLWAARFFKTRALAKQMIEAGRVEWSGATAKPSKAIRVGDRVQIRRGDERMDIEVSRVSETRGSAAVAQTLYRETEASIANRLSEREKRRLENASYSAPKTKPDKRARRLIQALGDIELL